MGLAQSRAPGVADGGGARADEAVKAAGVGAGRVGHREPARDCVRVSDPLVELDIELIVIERAGRDSQIVTCLGTGTTKIGSRQQSEGGSRTGVDEALGDLVARQRGADDRTSGADAASAGVINDGGVSGKISGAKCGRGNIENVGGGAGPAAGAFIVAEEEGLVLAVVDLGDLYRATEGKAELILLERLTLRAAGIGEEVVGVELFVAQKLPGAAVQSVGTRFRSGADNPAGGPAILGAETAGLHLEFLDGVNGGRVGDSGAPDGTAGDAGVVIHAIEQHVIHAEATAAGDERKVGAHPLHGDGVAGEEAQSERIATV